MALTEAQAAALVEDLETDAALLHQMVHGDAETEVATEGGLVPSIAKVIDDAETQLDMVLDEAEGEVGAAVATAEAWAEEDEDTEVEPGKYSAKHHALKAAAIAASLVNVLSFKGGWDASTAAYPVDPEVGDLYTITVAGTIAAVDWRVGDEMVYADTGWVQVGRDLTAAEIVALLVGEFSDAAHGVRGGGNLHEEATGGAAGFMSAADKTYLDGLPAALLNKLADPEANGLVTRTGADGATGVVAWSDWADWTPSVTFATPGDLAVTYHSRSGRWRRIGNKVEIYFKIDATLTYTTASSSFRIEGHPVAPIASAGGMIENISGNGNNGPSWAAGRTSALLYTTSGALFIRMVGSGVNASVLAASNFVTGNRYVFEASVSYEVAA